MTNKQNAYNRIRRIFAPVTVGANLLMIIGSILAMSLRGLPDMPAMWAMNAGMDLIGMLAGFVLLICCYVDIQQVGVDHRYYRFLVEISFIGLFTDLLSWLMNGFPEYRLIFLLVNTVYFIVTPMGMYYFWKYVVQITGEEGIWADRGGWILRIWFYALVLLCIANMYRGFFFFIDETGTYVRGPLFVLFMLYIPAVVAAVAALMVRRRKQLHRRQIVVLTIYLVAPFPVIAISIFVYGLSLNFLVAMLDMLIMYGVINVEAGREKMAAEQELATARSIQTGVLPHVFPLFPGRTEFDLHASMDPAKEVGGDFYDAFLVDEDHLALVMGDVSGKGVPAALFMVIAKTLIKNRTLMGGTPAEILMDVNPRLHEGNEARMFVTIWLGILTISTGKLVEANAGHEYPALCRQDGEFELLKRKHGMVCGGMKKVRYTDDEIDLRPGDTLFIYTDGVPEATNGKGERFGMERMVEALNRQKADAPEKLLSTVRNEVNAFVGAAPQFDDLTMLAITYKGGTV